MKLPFKTRFILFLLGALMYTIPFLFIGFWYLICAFIAMDWNPTHWLVYTTTIGRVYGSIMIMISMFIIIGYYSQLNNDY